MITVSDALTELFALASPVGTERVRLGRAAGRVLAQPVAATRDQPPFPASAMDGYAIAGPATPGRRLSVIGEAAAGHRFAGRIGGDDAVRIFTGAPVPPGADRVVIQEDVTRSGDEITIAEAPDAARYVRPSGTDFTAGTTLDAPRRLRPADIALIAAMNVPEVVVARRPVVAILPTGDELVQPGEAPSEDQIIASNSHGLRAALEMHGAEVRLLPIAQDRLASLQTALSLAAEADVIITIGGASVGDHDLVAEAAEGLGLQRAFYKVAMRPGKPLMAGRIGASMVIGLPGNPVSAMVCGEIFVKPVLDVMLGLPPAPRGRQSVPLAASLPGNGPREHYMRGRLGADGVIGFERQDSSLLTVLAEADCLIVRPPDDPPRSVGETVEILPI